MRLSQNTNVIALYSLVEKNKTQLTFYDSGIGTYARNGWRHYKQVLDHKIDLAIAWYACGNRSLYSIRNPMPDTSLKEF